ncbi:hypothetical protein ACLUX4_09055 [Limosilactobacillus reuteri subsp. suis]
MHALAAAPTEPFSTIALANLCRLLALVFFHHLTKEGYYLTG